MSLLFIELNESQFILQAYKKDDFVNICEPNGHLFCIDLVTNKITTTGKENKDWREKAVNINIIELIKKIELCNSKK